MELKCKLSAYCDKCHGEIVRKKGEGCGSGWNAFRYVAGAFIGLLLRDLLNLL